MDDALVKDFLLVAPDLVSFFSISDRREEHDNKTICLHQFLSFAQNLFSSKSLIMGIPPSSSALLEERSSNKPASPGQSTLLPSSPPLSDIPRMKID